MRCKEEIFYSKGSLAKLLPASTHPHPANFSIIPFHLWTAAVVQALPPVTMLTFPQPASQKKLLQQPVCAYSD